MSARSRGEAGISREEVRDSAGATMPASAGSRFRGQVTASIGCATTSEIRRPLVQQGEVWRIVPFERRTRCVSRRSESFVAKSARLSLTNRSTRSRYRRPARPHPRGRSWRVGPVRCQYRRIELLSTDAHQTVDNPGKTRRRGDPERLAAEARFEGSEHLLRHRQLKRDLPGCKACTIATSASAPCRCAHAAGRVGRRSRHHIEADAQHRPGRRLAVGGRDARTHLVVAESGGSLEQVEVALIFPSRGRAGAPSRSGLPRGRIPARDFTRAASSRARSVRRSPSVECGEDRTAP